MKALVKKEAQKGIWMEEVAVPKVGVNDVLIKIKKTAICGTDLHIYKWDEWSQKTIKTPMTIGHEYVGIVAEVGPGVRNIQVGDRVTGEGHIACGHCRNCRRGLQHICENSIGVGVNRDGAFAEYLCIPESNVVKLDDRISDDMAAIMDPFGNATHTALSFPLLGEDVLITGAGLIQGYRGIQRKHRHDLHRHRYCFRRCAASHDDSYDNGHKRYDLRLLHGRQPRCYGHPDLLQQQHLHTHDRWSSES